MPVGSAVDHSDATASPSGDQFLLSVDASRPSQFDWPLVITVPEYEDPLQAILINLPTTLENKASFHQLKQGLAFALDILPLSAAHLWQIPLQNRVRSDHEYRLNGGEQRLFLRSLVCQFKYPSLDTPSQSQH